MTKLTTHVLDIYSGKPGKGIKVELYFVSGENKTKVKSIILNDDGRSNEPLVENNEFKIGKYELIFFVGDYFKDITKNNDLKRLYGITLDEHTQMYEEQNGVCAICKGEGDGKWKKLCVDHDHKTGKVRQLLCRNCNMVLGQVNDNVNLLSEMIKYLQKHQ